jgi:pimeloyl-ACP methyl ester carboxylesterase
MNRYASLCRSRDEATSQKGILRTFRLFMHLRVTSSRRSLLPGKFSLEAIEIVLALAFVILGAGCATHEKQAAGPPLMQAERRLARAEKVKLNIKGQAAEYLAVAKISASEIGNACTATSLDSSQALALYNRAVADLAADVPSLIIQKKNSGTLELRDAVTGETAQLQIESGKPGEYQPASFRQILKAASINRKGLDENVTRAGVGGTVVGIQQSLPSPRLEPLKGYREPVTAVVDFPKLSRASARLRFFDPNKVSDVDLEGNRYPLAADFSAPLASYGRVNENWIGFLNMVRGERMRGGSGLLMMRPYDPTRIPVVFVHGLLSSAYVWRNVVNTLAADPEIRRHYQFWVFSYSTGNPIAYSAYLLRNDLQYAQKLYGFKQVILIGHSMGGILSRMQVTNAGRVIWNEQFKTKADRLYAEVPEDSLVKKSLIFEANPTVKRIIFVSTPHRGSTLATGGIGTLGMRLIRLPLKVASAIPKSVLAAAALNKDARKYQVPTSISGLSPSNPLFKALDKLPIEAPHNSIIGDRGRGDTPNSSDGVVPYWSSHLDSAQSEVIVPTDHGAMKSPKAVAEIRRILLLQMGAKGPKRPQAVLSVR